jgi:peptidoglycan/xylan/chitin deacetylase (PgdA/CDA1 family)
MPISVTSNREPIAILTYHQIAEAPPRGAPYRSLYVSPAAFSRQMAFLSALGYRGLSMSELMPYLTGMKTGKVVGITFDDGYLNNLTNALPVLQKQKFTATCYAVSQLLGKTNEWDREVGIAQTPLMTAGQLRDWVAAGQELGAHTRHHVHLNQCDADVGRQELALCKTELEAETDALVNHFCYPYGEFSRDHVAMMEQVGYQSATTTRRGRCGAGENLAQLPRISIHRTTGLAGMWLKVATRYEDRPAK